MTRQNNQYVKKNLEKNLSTLLVSPIMFRFLPCFWLILNANFIQYVCSNFGTKTQSSKLFFYHNLLAILRSGFFNQQKLSLFFQRFSKQKYSVFSISYIQIQGACNLSKIKKTEGLITGPWFLLRYRCRFFEWQTRKPM